MVQTVTESSLFRIHLQQKAGFFTITTYSYVLCSKCKVLPVNSDELLLNSNESTNKKLALCKKVCYNAELYWLKNFPCSLEKRARDQKEVQATMNKYELALVVNAKIEDDARVATVEKVKEYVTKFGGTITNVDDWGKKRLAYDIQKMREGFYYFVQFDADETVPAQVEKNVRIMENVIRFLCIRQDA